MALARLRSQGVGVRDDALMWSVERLRQAVGADALGHEREWAERMGAALARVEQALGQHLVAAEARDGPLAEVDQTRPTLARRSDELCRNQNELLTQAVGLREEVQCAGKAVTPYGDHAQTTALAEGSGVASIPDLAAIRERADELLAALQQNHDAEANLVLESVNTDIGAGD